MGTWGTDSFGNDTAGDWGYELRSKGLPHLQQTLQRVIDTAGGYLEATQAEEGIAAAEVIARLQGRWGLRNAYSEPVDHWVMQHPQVAPPPLAQQARDVIDRVRTAPSELLDMWQEGGQYAQWLAALEELKNRISV